MKEKFDVQGMTCSSCSAHVDRAVRKIDGVKNVNVNLLQNSMVVEYDENMIQVQDIIKAVQDAGYGASKIQKKSIDNSKGISSMKKRLIISLIFWIPLMYVAMHHMFYEWFGIPVPNFIKHFLHGAENRN